VTPPRLVIIETPYAAPDVTENVAYARDCMADSLARGEAPFASHLLYPQVLDDYDPTQRLLGITAGLAWAARSHATVVYTDRGISSGMAMGIELATQLGHPIEYRVLTEG